MEQNLSDIRLLAGGGDYDAMPGLKPYRPFDDTVLFFFEQLSSLLMKHPEARRYPDIVTFAFFCRKANTKGLKRSYGDGLSSSIGRGVTFHLAPSNVPINFAYSFAAGLLAGNACIVRTSSKPFPQTDIVSSTIATLLEEDRFEALRRYISIVNYGHSAEINNYFSGLCDIRIIWGGDDTIAEIRKAALPARSFDITFADRYSLSVIHAEDYLNIADKNQIALGFYNDTYLFDQNACSSPRLLYWVGPAPAIAKAKVVFWDSVHELLGEKGYRIETMTAVDKYMASCRSALDYEDVAIAKLSDNLINRVELKTLPNDLPEHACGGGSFFEYSDESADKLVDIVTRKFQTLTYVGFDREELANLLISNGGVGIDRIVPCGKAADFNLVWDGYDLIRQMSRVIHIE